MVELSVRWSLSSIGPSSTVDDGMAELSRADVGLLRALQRRMRQKRWHAHPRRRSHRRTSAIGGRWERVRLEGQRVARVAGEAEGQARVAHGARGHLAKRSMRTARSCPRRGCRRRCQCADVLSNTGTGLAQCLAGATGPGP